MPTRHALTDAQWRRIKPYLPHSRAGRPSSRGDRAFLDAVLWRTKTGCAWRDLPARYGSWKTIYNRFRDWSKRGFWPELLRKVHQDGQHAHSIIDSTVVRAHQHASGGRGGQKKTLSAAQLEASQRRSMLLSILEEILAE